jgi:hypothetical protein
MSFGKLNAARVPPLSLQEANALRARTARRNTAIAAAAVALVAVVLALAVNPKLLSPSWWFGNQAISFQAIGLCGLLVGLFGLVRWWENRERQQRRRNRSTDSSGNSIDLPDWCTDYTTGDGCGGDGGGDGGGGGGGGD